AQALLEGLAEAAAEERRTAVRTLAAGGAQRAAPVEDLEPASGRIAAGVRVERDEEGRALPRQREAATDRDERVVVAGEDDVDREPVRHAHGEFLRELEHDVLLAHPADALGPGIPAAVACIDDDERSRRRSRRGFRRADIGGLVGGGRRRAVWGQWRR